MNTPARINGHDSAHALQQLRNDRCQYATALHKALQYLELANMMAVTAGLPYHTPKGTDIADALDVVNRDLNGKG